MKAIPVSLAAALCAMVFVFPVPSASAHEPHEHGAARLDLAVEDASVTITLESPLANFLSFEHAPRTERQKADARALAARLRQADSLFRLSEAAGCGLEKVTLEAEALEEILREFSPPDAARNSGDSHAGHEGEEEAHSDLEAEYSFRCARPEVLHELEVTLFSVWPGLRDVDVRMVTPAGQGAAELTPEQPLIRW